MGIIVNVLEVKGNSDSVATDEQVITDAATSAVPAIIIGDSSIVVIPETTKAEPVHVEENGTAISGAAELATEPANTIEMAMGLNSTTAIITRDFVEETASQATLLPENIPTTTDDDQLIAAAIPDSGGQP